MYIFIILQPIPVVRFQASPSEEVPSLSYQVAGGQKQHLTVPTTRNSSSSRSNTDLSFMTEEASATTSEQSFQQIIQAKLYIDKTVCAFSRHFYNKKNNYIPSNKSLVVIHVDHLWTMNESMYSMVFNFLCYSSQYKNKSKRENNRRKDLSTSRIFFRYFN